MKILLILAMTFAASNIGCSTVVIRKFPERRYHACTTKEVKENVGKYCFRACKKYKLLRKKIPENCKLWYLHVLDVSDEKDFAALKKAGFVLIGEHRI